MLKLSFYNNSFEKSMICDLLWNMIICYMLRLYDFFTNMIYKEYLAGKRF